MKQNAIIGVAKSTVRNRYCHAFRLKPMNLVNNFQRSLFAYPNLDTFSLTAHSIV